MPKHFRPKTMISDQKTTADSPRFDGLSSAFFIDFGVVLEDE